MSEVGIRNEAADHTGYCKSSQSELGNMGNFVQRCDVN